MRISDNKHEVLIDYIIRKSKNCEFCFIHNKRSTIQNSDDNSDEDSIFSLIITYIEIEI